MTGAGGVEVQDRVELAYVPELADSVGAIRARGKATPAGRLQNGVGLIAAVGALYSLVVSFDGPGGRPAYASVFVCLLALVFILGLMVLTPTLQGRQVHRLYASQGEFRTVVDDATGLTLMARDIDMTYRWPLMSRYTETDDLFVMMSPDKNGVGLVVLPKRGLATGDADRLRAILDRRSQRAGR
ncbi:MULTISPECIES: YcxB family protein [Streptomyces]|uniref:YcxB family protein n=1 Tax=Streptomyces solicathayae TaxID=3081768 RepID=A0ABZ0M0A6_9ACTN|nr:YcxB family protein [Streptomyces sp. HUAS YS2]WOX24479.1 YcxB family protein [Streptomyces sp. HUAS YS2]